MFNAYQRTLSRRVIVEGIGLHSGKSARVEIYPARPNSGIVFRRSDLSNSPSIQAHFKNVVNTQMATTLGLGKTTISTVEHLMAALFGCGIDNALVEVNGPELPILDGSSEIYCEKFREAGLESQIVPRHILKILKRVEVHLGEKWAVAEASNHFELNVSIEWDHPAIGFQSLNYRGGHNTFDEIQSARTFGFIRDIDALKAAGLIKGGSLENAIVLNETEVLNPEGLRYADEFIRHKALDALGDLKLSGYEIQGKLRFHRAGHDLHARLVAEIFKDPANYQIVTTIEQVEESLRQPDLVPAAI